jgi:threonine dehydrogenase-like Zn-dependent dehydrogenase
MTTCRAAVFAGDGTYEVREFPVPEPPAGGAVLAVEAVGLCASDVAQLHGHKRPRRGNRSFPGTDRGPRTPSPRRRPGVAVGQRVAVDLVWRCGERALPVGSLYCERMQVWLHGARRRSAHGGCGVPEVPPGAQLLLTDDARRGGAVAVRALASVANWFGGYPTRETVLVQGPGHIPHLGHAGPRRGHGHRVGHVERALRLRPLAVGADHVIDVRPRPGRVSGRITGGALADVV